MSTCSHIYYPSPDSSNWLDIMSGDKAQIDPRTFEVHQIRTIAPRQPRQPSRLARYVSQHNRRSHVLSPRPEKAFVVKWLQNTIAIWENFGFDDIPENELEDSDEELCSIDEGELVPLCLEAVPPFPKQGDDNTLSGLHKRIHRKSVFTELFDDSMYPPYVEDEYYSLNPVLAPSAYTFSSSDNPSKYKDGNGTENVGKLIANKFRSLATHGVAVCRTLKEKLGR